MYRFLSTTTVSDCGEDGMYISYFNSFRVEIFLRDILMWILRFCRLSIVSQYDYVIDILLVYSTAHKRGDVPRFR